MERLEGSYLSSDNDLLTSMNMDNFQQYLHFEHKKCW